jgi:(p)ppGpp synthase/HD superfamily hydrolase
MCDINDNSNLLIAAIALAKKAHQNQFDKAGKPYLNHPIRVMNNVDSYEEKIVAILHDAIEDSDLTLVDLVELKFPIKIIEAIEAITKRNGEDYESYLQRVTIEDTEPFNLFPCPQRSLLLFAVMGFSFFLLLFVAGFAVPSFVSLS